MVKTLVNYGHLAILRDGHQSIDRGEYIELYIYMYPLHPLRPKPICHTPCSYQVTMAHAVSVCSKIGGYAKILTFFHGEKMFFWLGFSSAIQRFPTDR